MAIRRSDADTVQSMRAKGPLRVLVMLLAVSLLPALAVRATHEPSTAHVIATAQSLFMECFADVGQVTCLGSSQGGPRNATITPASGPLAKVTTEVTALLLRTGGWSMHADDVSFNKTLHTVGCNDGKAVGTFVDSIAGLSQPGSIPARPVGECSMAGELFVYTALPYYRITATLLPSAFSPTPSPTPKPTLKPTATPTATPKPTSKPTAAATATATATTSASESASSSATASESVAASPSGTPEQSVAGITFTPEPSSAPPAPAGGGDDWAGSVPSAGDTSTDGANLAGSALAALLLLLAMGFIGELFNNTFEANYDRILAGWRKSWLGRFGKKFSGLWGGGS